MTSRCVVDLDKPPFGGATFDEEQDRARLTRQLDRVRSFMTRVDCHDWWHTLHEISEALGYPEASISARLRDLRKQGFNVERRRVAGEHGLWEYRVQS
jgi:hypothetical protein